jgi:hypothetical protein
MVIKLAVSVRAAKDTACSMALSGLKQTRIRANCWSVNLRAAAEGGRAVQRHLTLAHTGGKAGLGRARGSRVAETLKNVSWTTAQSIDSSYQTRKEI